MVLLVVFVSLALVASAVGPDPCCLRVSPYHIQALAQRMSQRFQALEFRAQDLRNIFSAFQSIHGNVSTRLRFLESDHAQLHAELLRIDTRLQLLEAEKRIEEYRQRLNLDSGWYNSQRDRRESKLSSVPELSNNRSTSSVGYKVLQNRSDVLTDAVTNSIDYSLTENTQNNSESVPSLVKTIPSDVEFNSSDVPLLVEIPIPESRKGLIVNSANGARNESEPFGPVDNEDAEGNMVGSSELRGSEGHNLVPLPELSAPEINPELSLEVTETMFESVASNGRSDNASDLQLPNNTSGECCNQNLTTSNETEGNVPGLMLADTDLSDDELQEALKDLDRLLSAAPRVVPEADEDPEKVLLKRALALALEALDRTSDACLQLVNVTADAFENITEL